jgi:hypothetical protein
VDETLASGQLERFAKDNGATDLQGASAMWAAAKPQGTFEIRGFVVNTVFATILEVVPYNITTKSGIHFGYHGNGWAGCPRWK